MRVCIYTESALPALGGQELVVDALARRFVALGHEALVLAPQPRHALRANDAALPYPVVRHARFVSTRHFLGWYVWRLGKLYRKHRFDVLHCHSVYPTGYIAARCAAVASVPTVVTGHNGDTCPSSRLLKKPGLPDRFSSALRHADAVIAISGFVERRFRELCPQVRRVERIPNGVDLDMFARASPRPPTLQPAIQPGRYFLFLGRLVHRKGADLLLDAFGLAAAGHDAHLVIAGNGPEEAALRLRAATLGLVGRVHLTGCVEEEAKCYLLQHSLCTVMPSRISEGFPLVLLESYASGRPVIGTRIPGLDERIHPGRTGILVPPDSPPHLARALLQAIADRRLLDRLGTQARLVARDFDWRTVAARHLALFEDLLACRARRSAA